MTIRLKIIALLTVLIILSCSKENSLNTQKSILRISPATNLQTKALIDDDNISSQQIGIQITNSDGSQLYSNNNEYNNLRLLRPEITGPWIFDDGNNNTTDVLLSGDNAKIFAYYPYSPTLLSGTGEAASLKLDIPRQQTSGYVSDYLWSSQSTTIPSGANPINAGNSVVQIKLNHSLALVAFVIYKDEYNGAGNISKMDFKCASGNLFKVNKEISNDLKMNLSDGTISGGDLVSQITITDINKTLLNSDPGENPDTLFKYSNIQFLLAPVTFPGKGDIQFSIEIDGITYNAAFSGADPLQMREGNVYAFKAKLSPKMLTITGVQEWTRVDYEGSSGYDDLWYGMEPVQIGSLLWAPVNAGYDLAHPYGLLWHRKYGQTYNEAPLPTTIYQKVSLDDGNNIANKNNFYNPNANPYDWMLIQADSWDMSSQYNPCPEGWRVPTRLEFQSLASMGYKHTTNGIGGIPGIWLGGNYDTDLIGSVFFPYSGRKDPISNTSVSRDAWGYYWSTYINNSETSIMLMVSKDGANIGAYMRAYGNSVRCVKDL